MKRILVPTDFSPCALQATKVAAGIAKKTGARLFLLHVVNMPITYDNASIQSYQDTNEGLFILSVIKKRFEELMNMPFMKEVNAVEAIQFDGIYETIAKQAEDHDMDLIVMGSHGAGGLKEVFVGSNTERIIRLAKCPVLTVKNGVDLEIKDIAFASNFYGENDTVFNKVKDFADLFGAKLHLVKIITANKFETTAYSKRLMEDLAKDFGLTNYTINVYNDNTVEEGIHHFARDIDADLIAMTTHGRTGIGHLLHGSYAEDVANHATKPVLSFQLEPIPIEYGVIFPSNK